MFVSAGESAFEATLAKKLRASDPSVSPLEVIGTGATDVRTHFSPADIPFILRAYVSGIQTAFIVAIALTAACTIIALGAKRERLQPPSEVKEGNSTELSMEALDATSIV